VQKVYYVRSGESLQTLTKSRLQLKRTACLRWIWK